MPIFSGPVLWLVSLLPTLPVWGGVEPVVVLAWRGWAWIRVTGGGHWVSWVSLGYPEQRERE